MNVTKQLYQWDTGQKLTECTGLYVDFPIGEDIYRVETADGTCIIPDELLQTSGGHKVYECMTNNTIRSFAFSVTPRPKPPDYVYTPTEKLTFDGLVKKVNDAIKITAESEANALSYKTDAQLSKESAATSENKAAESEANAKLYAEQAAAVFSLAGDVSFTIGADKGVTMIFTTN